MAEITLSTELVRRIESLYEDMEAAYKDVAAKLDFTCEGCPDNCCDSHFLHHTYVEWAYLWLGFSMVDKEKQQDILKRCEEYVAACKVAEELDERPQAMCPLNEDGLCILYQHRLLVCRTHGVPAIIRFPDGQARHFIGCFRCQEIIDARFVRTDHAPHVDRAPYLAKLIGIEDEVCENKRAELAKVKMTIAEMLLAGPAQIK